MKIYLVGGAVRDQLLNLPIKEKDWVVVGATVNDMLAQGFRQVGKDFPVFLHPKTSEEYALARKERKSGCGYTGFTFDASPTVSLEEDLLRRDLTINAMAQTPDGVLIDPYHGKDDLSKKILRHVSPAFVEDPVRILRVARFAARFGFDIAPETKALMQTMVVSGEINTLVAERVWKELERALVEKQPENFFEVLADCNALAVLFPSIKLGGAGVRVLSMISKKSSDVEIRFAALLHEMPSMTITELCARYRVPTHCRELALLVANYLSLYQRAEKLNATELLDLFLALDAFRREERFKIFLLVCEACTPSSTSAFLIKNYEIAKKVEVQSVLDEGATGKAITERLNQKRIEAIRKNRS
ncbi:MAG TPA: multifunctional CCA tRNA nucleotidyl transferase/2'3'-cyclic phosphodiesterase/2'nucleotidase/phosphatase [Gammaproteobacteria bacterium]|nr:multifunctional CCA tRNA nucleotidyl transferase/2'3'-cyclic phosphodiesterase/2'nucleotidase/phosphatase [Gammaproteobacteria bacterium]